MLLFKQAKKNWNESMVVLSRLVLILAGALFYGTVTFQKILVSKFTVP